MSTFPCCSSFYLKATGLVRVRSSLLAESRLMSFPPATEIFQFAGFASCYYVFITGYLINRWVFPFRNFRIKAYSQLPETYRSVSRLSSPSSAKASTECSYFIYFEITLLYTELILHVSVSTHDINYFYRGVVYFNFYQLVKQLRDLHLAWRELYMISPYLVKYYF